MSGETSRSMVELGPLVSKFGGVCGGDLQRLVSGFGALATARHDQLAFIASARYRGDVTTSRASAILVSEADAALLADQAERLWVCDDPYLQFARVAQFFEAAGQIARTGQVDATAVVSTDATVDSTAIIGPHVVIGRGADIARGVRIGAGATIGERVVIGADSLIHPQVVVYDGCVLGARCIVHAGAVIGADGFGFAKDGAAWIKIPQVGGVNIGDDVEIGANTTIDRGALEDTRIGHGVKLDNQIQIGHNVQVGDHTIMAAFVGVAGSAIIGKRCMIGGAARIMGHVTIVDDTVISTQTFVSRSITRPAQYTGYYPMAEHAAFEKNAAALRRLAGLRDRVRRLESAATDPSIDTPEPESPA